MTDFIIFNYASNIVGIQPFTEEAAQWLLNEVEAEPWQFQGNILWIDQRYIENIINAIIEDNLTIEIME